MWYPISLCLVFIIINRSKKSGTKSCRLKSIKLAKVKKKKKIPPQKEYEALSLYHGNLTLISFFDTRQKLFFPEVHFNLLPPETFFFFYLHVHSTKNARTYFFFLSFLVILVRIPDNQHSSSCFSSSWSFLLSSCDVFLL